MSKMTVIQLLNKIANGEEMPKKIKYKNRIYEWKEYDVCYGKIMTKKGWVKELGYVAEENRTYFYLKHCYQDLNDTVEILEDNELKYKMDLGNNKLYSYKETGGIAIFPKEEKKIPEKVEMDFMNEDDTLEDIVYMTTINVGRLVDKINSIIDYLKSKGDK